MTLAPGDLKSPPTVRIGDRARIARREMKLNQPEFVALLREHLPALNDKTYASWEAGRNPDNLVEVAEALEAVTRYPWTWFLRGVYVETGGPGGGDAVDSRTAPRGRATLAQSAERFTRNDESNVFYIVPAA